MAKKKKRKIRYERLAISIVVVVFIIICISKIFGAVIHRINKPAQNQSKIVSQAKVDEEQRKIIRVVIDPAKGGNSKGMSSPDGTMKEKDINLDIAKRIKNKLDKYSDVKCILTREFDKNKTVLNRIDMANKDRADIFVSIRVNAQANGDEANGIETYYSNPDNKREMPILDNSTDVNSIKNKKKEVIKKDRFKNDKDSLSIDKSSKKTSSVDSTDSLEDDKDLAERKKFIEEMNAKEKANEVKTSIKSNSDEGSTKSSRTKDGLKNKYKNKDTVKTQNTNVPKGDNLSELLAKSIQKTSLSYVKMGDRGILMKNFDVLNYTTMPSVIVQSGFITNKGDGNMLQNDEERENIASGISEGILNFIDSNRADIIADRVNHD